MFPVFSLVLDEDVPAEIALRFPELYKDLSKVIYGINMYVSICVYNVYYFSVV